MSEAGPAGLALPPALRDAERTAFVGRLRERERLESVWAAAARGGRSAVMVSGEAGIGKSRLVREVARAAFADGATVLMGRCTEESLTPYQPFVEALDDWAASMSDAVLSRAFRPELTPLLPRLAERLGIAAVPAQQPAEFERWHLFEAVTSLLGAMGADRPVMVVLDDLHWVDRSSALLLTHVVRRASGARLAVVGTHRGALEAAHPLARALNELRRDHLLEQVALDGLDRDSTLELLTSLGGPRGGARWANAVHARTDGNPFFVEELWRHVAEIGARPESVLRGGVVEELDLPEGIRQLVASRLAQLSDLANDVLAAAAVVGERFGLDVVQQMSGLDQEAALAALDETLSAGLVSADPEPLSLRFGFKHALVRDTVYYGLARTRRQVLHRRAAEAIASSVKTSSPTQELARHWLGAGQLDKALPAALLAAGEAEAVWGWAEADGWFLAALKLWDKVPDAAAVAGIERTDLLRRAAEAAYLAGDSDRAVSLVEDAIVHSDKADRECLGMLYERLGRYRWTAGATGPANEAYSQAIRVLAESPPSVRLARVLAAGAHVLLLQDRHLEAIGRSQEALAMARQLDAIPEQGYALCNLGTSLAFIGRISEGATYLEQARRIAQDARDPSELARVLVCLAAVLLYEAGQLEEAARVALEAAATARQSGVFRLMGGMALAYAADAYLRLGRWDECDQLTAAPDLLDAPPPIALPLYLVRAELEMRRGRFDQAQALVEVADSLSAGMPDAKNRGYYLLRQAELAMWNRHYDDVRNAVRDGLTLVAAADNQDRFGPEMCAIGVRAEADRKAARAGRDRLGRTSIAREIAAELVLRAREITRLSLDRHTMPAPDASAFAVMCEAELSRFDQPSDPDRWAAAIIAWEVAGQPYQAAYSRFRLAEAALAGRRPNKTAATVLAQALDVARSLNAAPLIADINQLATRAHLDLPAHATPTKSVPDDGIDQLGLTPREAEVLRLLSTGQTNSQIASVLFISEKTASVHVSNILRKLDVRSRLEAAAIAQRLLHDPP